MKSFIQEIQARIPENIPKKKFAQYFSAFFLGNLTFQ